MPQCGDAELLQVLVREARKNRLVYLVLAEGRLVLPKAKAPQQTTTSMSAPRLQGCRTSSSRPGLARTRG
jgi:hypothetical protein